MTTGAFDDTLNGEAGDDVLNGGAGNDVLDGGTGNDSLRGGTGNDTYVFGRGSGSDTIDNSDGGSDRVLFGAGIVASDLTFTKIGNNLQVLIANATDTLTVTNWFLGASYQIGSFVLSDGSTVAAQVAIVGTSGNDTLTGTSAADNIVGLAGNDTINAGGGNDTLTGGLGNDTMDGAAGLDVYVYRSGDGADVISESSTDNGDTLRLPDLNPSDVIFSKVGGQLQMKVIATGQTLSVNNEFYWNGLTRYLYGLERIEFANGTVWDLAKIDAEAYIRGTAGADSLTGTNGPDTLDGAAGNDTINGGFGDDILIGGAGNDSLNGYVGNDTYVFGVGSGNDIVDEFYSDTGDRLRLVGLSPSDVTFTRTNNHLDLVVTINATGETIKINNQWDEESGYPSGVEYVEFANGTVWDFNRISAEAFVRGTAGADTMSAYYGPYALDGGGGNDTIWGGPSNDVLMGGTGNDTLLGGGGNDTYLFSRGDGQDYLVNGVQYAAKNGELKFGANVASNQLWFQKSNTDLIVSILGTQDRVTVAGWYSSNDRQLNDVKLSNGLMVDTGLAQLVQAMATYSASNSGFNITSATQAPADTALQNAIAAAWHA